MLHLISELLMGLFGEEKLTIIQSMGSIDVATVVLKKLSMENTLNLQGLPCVKKRNQGFFVGPVLLLSCKLTITLYT